MKLNIGDRVTGKRWYMKRRVYGKIFGKSQDDTSMYFVRGKFGEEEFHKTTLRKVNAK